MRLLIVFIIVLGLAACSSSVSVDYYQLTTTKAGVVIKPEATKLFIQPVQVASYLNSKSLIMQVSPVQLVLARQHLWAESLDQQIQRKLANTIELTSPDYAIALQSNPETVKLLVNIEQFHGTADGYAVFSGRYSVQPVINNKASNHNYKNASQLQDYRFSYQLPLQADGYPALVTSLSQAVEQLAVDVLLQLSNNAA